MAKNIKMNKKKLGLIGGIVLVNTFLVSVFSLGGHVPGKLDDTKKFLVTEQHTINDTTTINNYYSGAIDKKNYVIHYGKPYIQGNKILKTITIKYDNNRFHDEIKIVPCDSLDEEDYIETVTYNQDFDDYIIVKQSMNGEIMDDIVLLSSMLFSSTMLYTVGKSINDREEKKLIKE